MGGKVSMLLILLVFAFSTPAYGSFQAEWEATAALSDPAAGDGFFWSTGLHLRGAWPLGEKWVFSWRGGLSLNSLAGELDATLARGYLQYESGPLRLALGRQAVSWGVGWFFRPTDLITPRSPLSAEEGRPGKDLLTVTCATSPVTNVELTVGDALYGARAGWQIGRASLRTLGLVAPDGRKMVGLDLQGGLHGFYGEACYEWQTDPRDGAPAVMLGWRKLFGEGRLLYLEYLRDERGRFLPGRDYLAAGLEIPLDELTTYAVALEGSLGDGGYLLAGTASLVLSDHLDLNGGVGLILGPEGTEFLTLARGSRVSLTVGTKYYF